MPVGGRTSTDPSSDLWFTRSLLSCVLRRKPTIVAPVAKIAQLKRLAAVDGRKVEATPPLRALEQTLGDDAIATLVDRGYVVVDNALPPALCRKLKAEMQALEANGQMWNSRSYGNDDAIYGTPHHHIHETQLDYKEVRKHAPTFARIEHDPSLLQRVRGVPGLEKLGSQHVRIQINAGFGGCYTMHTDSGTSAFGAGQTLMLTALFYLNDDWEAGDGGELRVFPFPHAAEVIAPLQGRMVLFEPRMVHDVLPNYRKRFCFTLWCAQKGHVFSKQIDHESAKGIELAVSLAKGAKLAEAWRGRERFDTPYSASLPYSLRPLFLPEMRAGLVRIIYADDEIGSVAQSHEGETRQTMIDGISGFHQRIRAANPGWLMELLRQLPAAEVRRTAAPAGDGGGGAAALLTDTSAAQGYDEDQVRLDELRAVAHRLAPWWI